MARAGLILVIIFLTNIGATSLFAKAQQDDDGVVEEQPTVEDPIEDALPSAADVLAGKNKVYKAMNAKLLKLENNMRSARDGHLQGVLKQKNEYERRLSKQVEENKARKTANSFIEGEINNLEQSGRTNLVEAHEVADQNKRLLGDLQAALTKIRDAKELASSALEASQNHSTAAKVLAQMAEEEATNQTAKSHKQLLTAFGEMYPQGQTDQQQLLSRSLNWTLASESKLKGRLDVAVNHLQQAHKTLLSQTSLIRELMQQLSGHEASKRDVRVIEGDIADHKEQPDKSKVEKKEEAKGNQAKAAERMGELHVSSPNRTSLNGQAAGLSFLRVAAAV